MQPQSATDPDASIPRRTASWWGNDLAIRRQQRLSLQDVEASSTRSLRLCSVPTSGASVSSGARLQRLARF
jgi:hypothetical protein